MAHSVVWFDLPVVDLDRAIQFYTAVLGADVHKDVHPQGALGVLPHGPGEVSGCLVTSGKAQPSQDGPLLYFNVNGRLDKAIAEVESHGGQILEPRHTIGPYGHRAVVVDSEGNRIALHSTT